MAHCSNYHSLLRKSREGVLFSFKLVSTGRWAGAHKLWVLTSVLSLPSSPFASQFIFWKQLLSMPETISKLKQVQHSFVSFVMNISCIFTTLPVSQYLGNSNPECLVITPLFSKNQKTGMLKILFVYNYYFSTLHFKMGWTESTNLLINESVCD